MRTGDKILNYSVTRRLKAGGMGVVFEGEQTWGSRRKVAIKQLLENLRDDETIRRRFIREAEILEMLDNPRIVKILGFDHEQDAFVMEFVEGQTLSDLLKQDPHRFRESAVLVEFMASLLDAFSYAHHVVLTINDRKEKGIVHRDIKPSNIIVQPDGSPKILDFGISRVASFQSTLTDPKLQMGSVPYMSPEQIATPIDVDWRSDIYSLGVTLWEMVTGRSPYPRVTTHEVVVEVQRQIRFEALPSLIYTIPDQKPDEQAFLRRLDLVIAKATAKDRAYRYQDCSEMKAALERAMADQIESDRPEAETLLSKEHNQSTPPRVAPRMSVRPEPAPDPIRPEPMLAPAPEPLAEAELPQSFVDSNAGFGRDGTLIPPAPNRTWMVYAAIGLVVLIGGLTWWFINREPGETMTPKPVAGAEATEVTMATLVTADSCYEVGNNHYNAKEFTQAAYWYQKAADLGNSDSQSLLGSMYQHGQGLQKDYAMAVKWFRASAEQSNAEGQKNLGYMYYLGLGVSKDYEQAMKWYRASAEQGNPEGQANLGIMYEQGLGISENVAEAIKWYQRAANQNYPRAQYYVGTMYASGKGVPLSQPKAVQWYQLAARQGDPNAQQELRRLNETW